MQEMSHAEHNKLVWYRSILPEKQFNKILGRVMMRKLLIASAVAVGTMLGVSGQASAACGTVSIAEMNWASAQLMANVDKIILESGYGCKVDIVPGDTMPTFTSMNEKGQPDVAGELWVNAVATPLDAAKAEGRLHTVSEGRLLGWEKAGGCYRIP
jgi:glycine betaine/proline transport system substrate-binding protein